MGIMFDIKKSSNFKSSLSELINNIYDLKTKPEKRKEILGTDELEDYMKRAFAEFPNGQVSIKTQIFDNKLWASRNDIGSFLKKLEGLTSSKSFAKLFKLRNQIEANYGDPLEINNAAKSFQSCQPADPLKPGLEHFKQKTLISNFLLPSIKNFVLNFASGIIYCDED